MNGWLDECMNMSVIAKESSTEAIWRTEEWMNG